MQDNRRRDVWISKTLSWLLRHGAVKEGLSLSKEGFIPVTEILNYKNLKSQQCTIDDIKRIVANNDKQRFALRTTAENGVLEIRANQGHSISDVLNLELVSIDNSTNIENVIHGTYLKFWDSIKRQGLHRGNRNHIHFAIGLPKNVNVISGVRKSAEIYIYIDLPKALSVGLKFFLSANNVILSPGDDKGFIKPDLFLKVCRSSDLSELSF